MPSHSLKKQSQARREFSLYLSIRHVHLNPDSRFCPPKPLLEFFSVRVARQSLAYKEMYACSTAIFKIIPHSYNSAYPRETLDIPIARS